MRILIANLSLLCRYSGLWVFNALLAIAVVLAVVARFAWVETAAGAFTIFLGAAFALGLTVAGVQVIVMVHPFAFNLPNYQAGVRRLVFVTGSAISLGASLVFPAAGLSTGSLVSVHCAAFFAALIVYSGGAAASVRWMLTGHIPACVTGMLIIGGINRGLHLYVAEVIAHSPGVITALGLACAAALWGWLGHRPWYARGYRMMRIGWLRATVHSILSRWEAKSAEGSRMQTFLLDRVCGCEHTSVAKHVWAALYASFVSGGAGRSYVAGVIGVSLAVVVGAWYWPFLSVLVIVAAGPGAVGEIIHDVAMPLYTTLPLVGGRRERFIATMVLLAIILGTAVSAILLFSAAMGLLNPAMPKMLEFLSEGEIRPLSLRTLAFLSLPIPIVSLIGIFFPKRRFLMFAARFSVMYPPVVILESAAAYAWTTTVPLPWIIVSYVLVWSVFACGIYWLAMRGDLVRR